MVQGAGAALVLDGHADLVARAGADGVHLTGLDDFAEALERLKPERIVGVGGLATRHDCMLVAERGADYVMFGMPDAAGRRPPFEAIEERVAWWAELFELPCVAYADTLEEIAAAGRRRRRFHRARRLAVARRKRDRGDAADGSRALASAGGDRVMAPRLTRAALGIFAALLLAAPALGQGAKTPDRIVTPAPQAGNGASAGDGQADLAYGAFQRGYYLTALKFATARAEKGDPQAMTLIGEIYANGLGVARDESKAAHWYKLAADRGDADAMFALAMLNFSGRGVPRNQKTGIDLLEKASKRGQTLAEYDLGLLYMQGKDVLQDLERAAQLLTAAAAAGNDKAQYALGTLYKEGRGVPKDQKKAMELMGKASVAGNLDAMVEYAIAEFNGNGVEKNESAAAELVPARGAARQPGGAGPAGAHPDGRARHAGEPDRGGEMAHHRQGRRRQRSHAGGLCRQAEQRGARGRRQGRQEMAVDAARDPPLTARRRAGRPHLLSCPAKAGHPVSTRVTPFARHYAYWITHRACPAQAGRMMTAEKTGKLCTIPPCSTSWSPPPARPGAPSSAISARSRSCRSRSKGRPISSPPPITAPRRRSTRN